jgi:hypothetical protein
MASGRLCATHRAHYGEAPPSGTGQPRGNEAHCDNRPDGPEQLSALWLRSRNPPCREFYQGKYNYYC